jgi:TonB-linked SusC/RagA family outer membrane protein
MKTFQTETSPQLRKKFFFAAKMKIFIFLITAFQFTLSAQTNEPRLSISFNNAGIEDAIVEIKKQSGYNFFYAHEEINLSHRINLTLKNAPLSDVLKKCFENSGSDYEIVDKVIIIKPSKKQKESDPQKPVKRVKISGRVTSSEDGYTMPGVSILVKGTTTGTTTDLDGKYTLDVPENSTLAFSFIGFETQESNVLNKSEINIVLKSGLSELDEVIVTAIGTTVKVDETGTTSSIVRSEDIVRSGEAGIINSLAGKASGVRIGKSNGDPGSGSAIQIRGSNTIAGASQPLIIVDGMPVSNDNIGAVTVSQQSRLDDINPKDIESIQILKGASAAALWGSRAANGVIVITTKNGALNKKPVVQYSFNQSFDEVSIRQPIQDIYGQGQNGVWSSTLGESWGDKIANRSGGADDLDLNGAYFISNTTGKKYYKITKKNSKETFVEKNWDLVMRTGSFSQHNVSVTGGGEKTSYFFSFENMDQKGIIRNYDYHRRNFRLNSKTHLYDWLVWDNKITYTNTNSNRVVQAGETTNGIMLGLLRTAPDYDNSEYIGTYVDSKGVAFPNRQVFYRSQLGESANPLYSNPLWTINEQKAPSNVNRFIINPELKIYPTEWLRFIIRGGLDFYYDTRGEFYPIGSSGAARANGLWTNTDIKNRELNLDGIMIATHNFSKNIKVTATLGVNYNDRHRFTSTNTIAPFAVDSRMQTSDLNPDKAASLWNTSLIKIRSNRGYGVLSTELFDQLFITISGAFEAASTIKGRFFYPSVDLAWQFTDVLNTKLLSFGKLRLAWGKVGIQPAPYKFSTLATTGFASFGGSFLVSSEKGNENLKPEIKTELEIGTDLRFLKNRLDLGFTYYKNQTKDILFAVKTNASSGYSFHYKNAAVIENKGIEIDLNGKIIDQKEMKFSMFGNFNKNNNLVVDIAGAETVDIGGTSKAVKGYPMSSFYLPGSVRDENNNLVLDANGFPRLDTKYRVLGDPNPDWRGGLGAEFVFKKFDFSVLFEHSHGGEYIDRTKHVLYGFGLHPEVSNEITLTENLKRINGQIVTAGTTIRGNIANFGGGNVLLEESYYRGIGGGLGFNKLNDFFVEDATWTKLRNIAVGYTFSKLKITKKFAFNSVRISVTGRDLILWTKLKGIDPETNNYGVSNASGMNYFNNPATRSVLFNLQVNF